MSKNDVLVVGAASSIILTGNAWLTGYFDNRLFAWIGILSVISIGSGLAWYMRSKNTTYQEIAKYTAVFGAIVYVGSSLLGLITTKWAHGTWNPELLGLADGLLNKLFNQFPGNYMKTILHPTLSTIIFGALLMAIWASLGSSFLPVQDPKNTKSKKGSK